MVKYPGIYRMNSELYSSKTYFPTNEIRIRGKPLEWQNISITKKEIDIYSRINFIKNYVIRISKSLYRKIRNLENLI